MFEDYKKALLEFYKKEIGQLSENLQHPGRQKLRNECLNAVKDKNRSKDEQLLRRFFDPSNEYEDLARSIEKFELDKFRPLVNFLVRGTKLRDELSVKLLAWLIGFDTYSEWRKKKETPVPTIPVPTTEGPTGGAGTPPIIRGLLHIKEPVVVQPPKSLPFRRSAFISICILIFGSGCFILWENNLTRTHLPNENEQCMYWDGYKYEPANCDDNTAHTLIPINIHAINYFKKIRYPDTLTQYSLGKVWYSKINGKLEYFTDSGTHPVDTTRKLRSLSPYMLNKYSSFYRYELNVLGWSVGIIVMTFLVVFLITLSYKNIKSALPKLHFNRIRPVKSIYLSLMTMRSK
ncbi:hypothetical protein [Pedobacter sp.]|jgi:hypothetical protein|uniref:hypothetical protein n=1 Tax=Pedobacter sp. TaxID=1411316 RepID=UPI002BCCE01E|nr:hypothetical protein [Pedobacter sp.]HWW40120.1 hypothetical protein [Pedobacter sp.]